MGVKCLWFWWTRRFLVSAVEINPELKTNKKNYIHELPTDYWGSEIHFKIPLHEHELSHHFYLAINENLIYLFIYTTWPAGKHTDTLFTGANIYLSGDVWANWRKQTAPITGNY